MPGDGWTVVFQGLSDSRAITMNPIWTPSSCGADTECEVDRGHFRHEECVESISSIPCEKEIV